MAELATVQELSREQLEQAAALSGIPTEGVSDEELQTSVANQATPEQIAGILTAEPTPPADDAGTDGTPGTNNEADTLNNPDGDDIEADPVDPVAAQAATADEPTESFKGTRTVYARLVKSFEHPRGHRRAGIAFATGPVPLKLSVTSEQLSALKGDAAIELVNKAEYEKRVDLAPTAVQEGSTPEQQDPALVAGEPDTRGTTTGRNRRYATDPTRADSPEFDAESARLGATVTDPAPTTDGDLPEVSTDLKVAELAAIATAENVEGAEGFSKPGVKKQVIVDAIVANRTKE